MKDCKTALFKFKVKQPDRLEDSPNCSKNMKKEADITENSPGSSDLSDDAAPTLEKEEVYKYLKFKKWILFFRVLISKMTK